MYYRLVVVLAVTLLAGCGASQSKETRPDTPSAGRIRGVVRLLGTPPALRFEPVTADQETCGTKVSVQRLAVGKNNGVQDTFVYLDGVPADPDFHPPAEPVLVDQKRCQYSPHALIVPLGSKLAITNSDPILHNVHGYESTGHGSQTLFKIAQPVRGQRNAVDSPLTKPGIIPLSCEAGHPWMSGFIFVASNRYAALTSNDGEFTIKDVPPGTYYVKMWHEGVTRQQNLKALQRYEYEDPYEMTQEVVVTPGADAVVNFDLALRP